MRKLFEVMASFVVAAVIVAGLTATLGCASVAQLFEVEISNALEPIHVVFKDDRVEIYREYCVPGEGCLKRMEAHELVELTLDDGTRLRCKVSEEILDHVDGSQNHWIWPISSNDKRCTEEMERDASTPD